MLFQDEHEMDTVTILRHGQNWMFVGHMNVTHYKDKTLTLAIVS